MATPLEIVIATKYSGAGAKAAVADIKNVGDAAQAAGTKVTALGERIDGAGRRARIGLSSIAQLGNVAGVSLGGIVGPAASAADAVGDLAGAFGGLGVASVGLGAIVGAFALLIAKVQEQNSAMVAAAKANDAWLSSLKTVGEANAQVAAQIDRVAQAQVNLAQSQQRIFGAGSANLSAQQLAAATYEKEVDALWRLTAASGSAGEALKTLAGNTTTAANAGRDYNAELEKMIQLTAGQANAAASMATAERTADGWMGRLGVSTKATGDLMQRGKAILDENAAALRRWASEGAAKAAQAASQLRSMVESALTPTAADPNMGNAWDEARKRFEAFASGTDLGAYGEDFKKMFEGLGMSAADAAAKFKDFSLFADPANLQLIDWGPVVANVEQQLLALAGKANVVAEAMKQVWANLSPQAKSALAAQGIDNSTEAIQALVDPAGAAKDKVNELSDAIKAVPTAVTTTFAIEKGNSKDGSSFDDMLQKIKDAVNSIPTNIEVAVHLANGIPTADGSPTPPTTTPGGVKGFAHGGFIKREGLAYLHAGERVLNEQETEQFGQLPDNWRMLAGGWRGSRRGLYRKWLQSVQPPAEELAASGSVGGDGSAAGVGRIEDLLESIDRTLRYIAARGGMQSSGAAQPDMDALYNAMIRRLGRAAALRGL